MPISSSAPDSETARYCIPASTPPASLRSKTYCTGDSTPPTNGSSHTRAVVYHVQVDDRGVAQLQRASRNRWVERLDQCRGARARQRDDRRIGAQRWAGRPSTSNCPSTSRHPLRSAIRAPAITSTPAARSARCRRLPHDLALRAAVKADVPRVRAFEQATLEDERRQRQRRLVGGQVERGQRDQVPQRRRRARALAVGGKPRAEGLPVELRRARVEAAQRQRRAHRTEALAQRKGGGSAAACPPGAAAPAGRSGAARSPPRRGAPAGSPGAAATPPRARFRGAQAARGRRENSAGTRAGRCRSAGHRARRSTPPRPAAGAPPAASPARPHRRSRAPR